MVTSAAVCQRCDRSIPWRSGDLTPGALVLCSTCDESFELTRGAVFAEYGPLVASVADIPLGYIPGRSDDLVYEGKHLPGGYEVALFGVQCLTSRDNGVFKYSVDPSRRWLLEVWEARISLPGQPQAYWQKLWRPDGEQEATLEVTGRTSLAASQATDLVASHKLFAHLPLNQGGRS